MPIGKHLLGRPKRSVFGTVRVGDKGQIVIPKEARRMFDIQPGDTLLLVGDEKNGIVISRPELLRSLADQIMDGVTAVADKPDTKGTKQND